jgi:glycosyltransferase involved in cell wall biosynthesis
MEETDTKQTLPILHRSVLILMQWIGGAITDIETISYIGPIMIAPVRIAIVHDWLTGMRGGEKVLEILCELYPAARLYTLLHREGSCSKVIESMPIRTSFLQHLPSSSTRYQYYLPIFPLVVESLDLRAFDLVISSSHAVAKGVVRRHDAVHVCYCHTPMRYIWDQYEQYFGAGRSSLPVRLGMKLIRPYLQRWDISTTKNVTSFLANSQNVRERILRIYGRDSHVVYPPVDIDRFSLTPGIGEYYLIVSALVPYKRIDIAIAAFNRTGEKLVVVGTGSEESKLKRMAGRNIQFAGWVCDHQLRNYYQNCRALIFPGEEDFGIVPVEAMACGKPVIAFGRGGVLESVIDGVTGVFFKSQTESSLVEAIQRSQTLPFDPEQIRETTRRFHPEICRIAMQKYVNMCLEAGSL